MKPILTKKNVDAHLKRFVESIDTWLDENDTRLSVDWRQATNLPNHLCVGFVFYAKVRGLKFYTYKTYRINHDATEVSLLYDSVDGFFPDELELDRRVSEWARETHTEILKQKGARALSNRIREELMAAVWHPRRVAWRLDAGGWDAIESF
jgi:hypothetical protein